MSIQPLQHRRDWNTDDFVTKYNKAHIETNTPIPGSQLAKEVRHQKAKVHDRNSFAQSLDSFEAQRKERTHVLEQLAEIKARVAIETAIGSRLSKIEGIINDKRDFNIPHDWSKVHYDDSEVAIAKFMKNVELGRDAYVGFAIVSGFKSLNYQDPATGNTFLHVAVRLGHVETVEELLKYRFSPEMKNRLGNVPAHDAWLFHRNYQYRKREDRIAQEDKTCKILLKIFSYGACVDAMDQKGQTPLHIACRLGPVKAVLLLLGFKADHTLRTAAGEDAIEIAAKAGREDVLQILRAWHLIARETKKIDFNTLWLKFVRDHEALMTKQKTAAEMMADFDQGQRLAKAERGSIIKGYLPIDDPLLLQVVKRREKEVDDEAVKPKPWEAGWKKFAEECERQKQFEAEQQLRRDMEEEEVADKEEDAEAAAFNLLNLHRGVVGLFQDRGAMVVGNLNLIRVRESDDVNEGDSGSDAPRGGGGSRGSGGGDVDETKSFWSTLAGKRRMASKDRHVKQRGHASLPLPRVRLLDDPYAHLLGRRKKLPDRLRGSLAVPVR